MQPARSASWPFAGGTLGARISTNAFASKLGPSARWPQPLRTAVEIMLASPVPMALLWGSAGTLLHNEAYGALTGCPDVLGLTMADCWAHSPLLDPRHVEAARAGSAVSTHTRAPAHGGAPALSGLEVAYSPVRDEQGDPAGVLVIFQRADAAAESAVEQHARLSLWQSQQLCRKLAEQLPGGAAFVVDHDLRYLMAEGPALALVGMTQASLEGKTIDEVVSPELLPSYQANYRQALGGTPFSEEHVVQGRTYVTHGVPLFDETGAIYAALALSTDVTARSQAEARFQAVQEASLDGFMLFESVRDASGKIGDFRWAYANRAGEQIFRRPPGGCVGRLLLEELPGHRAAGLFDAYVRVVETGEPWASELAYQHDGLDAYVRLVVARVDDGFAVSIGDLSERRRAEEQLRASEERFRSLFEAIDEGFCIVEVLFNAADQPLDCRLLQANPAFERHTGLTGVVGRTARELVPALEAFWVEIVGQVARSHETMRVEYTTAQGLWFDVYASRVGDAASRQVAVVFNDITERKVAEEQIARANYRFRLAEAAARSFIFEWDLDTGLVSRNENLASVVGYAPHELAPTWQGWADLGLPEDPWFTMEAEAVAYVRSTDQDLLSAEYRLRHKDGQIIWVLERAFIVRDPHGIARRLIGQTTDITERKEFEAERERLYAQEQAARFQAEEVSRIKDEFLATVSHELRTPLTALLGYAELLEMRPDDPAYVVRTAAKLLHSATAQAQLIEDLLDISRIVSGKLRVELEPVNLAEVIGAALDTVRPTLDAKQLQLHVIMAPLVEMVVGDSRRLQQVVWNLLTNAVKFTPAGGTISVHLGRQATYAELTISDTGEGISPEFLPYVFDRFRQADGSSQRKHGGLGLGLAIVHHLVDLHGGTVRAESAGEGRGATFTVRLPLAVTTTARAPAAPTESPARPQRVCPPELLGLRVLLVDDQPQILELVEEILTVCGAAVQGCVTAREALAEVRLWRPDVLVADIAMPGEDGLWLIGQVRSLPAEAGGATPALALTAYVRFEDQQRVLAAGFQRYLPKPVDQAELCAALASLVRLDR